MTIHDRLVDFGIKLGLSPRYNTIL